MYTALELKNTYKKFALAKQHFGVKARGWEKLCEKLNNGAAINAEKAELISRIKFLENELAKKKVDSDLGLMLLDLVYKRGVSIHEIFESDEAMVGEPEGTRCDEWVYSEKILKRRYFRLSKIFHPDCNGSGEQMNNLITSYNMAKTLTLAMESHVGCRK